MRIEEKTDARVDDDQLSPVASGLAVAASSSLGANMKNPINITPNGIKYLASASESSSSSHEHIHHGPVKMPIKINNITTSQQLVDTLHHESRVIILNYDIFNCEFVSNKNLLLAYRLY